MSGIQFNTIPGSGLVAPIFTFEVNSGGQYTSVDRAIVIGHKTSGGAMALNTPIPVSSQQQADYYAGANSQLREMARVMFRNAPAIPMWIMAIDDTGLTANVRTITIAGTPGVGVGTFELMGETIQIGVTSSDTVTTIAAAIAAAINGYYNQLTDAMLPFTATASSGVVTLAAANKGAMFNEIDIYVPTRLTNNVFTGASVFTVATTTPGAGTPTTVGTALAALGDNPADFVICPWSDSTSLSAYAAWSNDISGRWAWSRQTYGHVWSAAVNNFSGLTTLGLSLNDRHLSLIGCYSAGSSGTPHPSYIWVASIAARLFSWLTDVATGNIARAHDGLVVEGLRPPRDASVWPNYNGRNTLNNSGISTWTVGADGSVRLSKVITTYRTGISGQPDAVFRDIQSVYQVSEGLKYMRARLADLLGQKAIVEKNPGSLSSAVTPADIKADFVGIYQELCAVLVFQNADTFAKLIVVQINAVNRNRVDVFCPMERVNPLDILAVNATIYQQFPKVAA